MHGQIQTPYNIIVMTKCGARFTCPIMEYLKLHTYLFWSRFPSELCIKTEEIKNCCKEVEKLVMDVVTDAQKYTSLNLHVRSK